MGRGGGNGRRRISTVARGNNRPTQGSNDTGARGNNSPAQGSNDTGARGNNSPTQGSNDTGARGNNSPTQGSNGTVGPDHEPLSSPMEVGLEDIPVNADDYTTESSQRLVQGSNTTQQTGSHTTQQTPARSLHKTFLIPLGNKFNVQGVSGVVREILIGMFNGNWPTWKKVPKKSQDLMWERFQSKFQWDPQLEAKVKKNWEGILKGRFRDLMRDVRDDAIKMATGRGVAVGDDWSVLKPFHPDWIDEGNWAAMIDDCWNTDSWKRKSVKNKRNRATLTEGKMAGHSGGSRSMIHTQVYMEKERGGPVSFIEVYESYFTKKGLEASESREYTTPKAGIVVIVPTLWEKACGGMKKGNLFGATKDILVMADGMLNGGSPHTSHISSTEEVQNLKEEVKRQKRQAETAEREAEHLKKKMAELQEREKVREVEMKSLQDQMKVFTMFMQGKMPQSN